MIDLRQTTDAGLDIENPAAAAFLNQLDLNRQAGTGANQTDLITKNINNLR